MKFYPDAYLPRFVTSAQDIFEIRHILRDMPFDNATIDYLSTIIIQTFNNKKRFRVYDCLKVLRAIIKSRQSHDQLSEQIILKLFEIYKQYIFSNNELTQWCVSTLIKDQVLSEECIKWLIDHYGDSVHIVNRILRYPMRNPLIEQWAVNVYKDGRLENRRSELVSLLINGDVPGFVHEKNINTIIWAIYYAKTDNETKKRLLCKHGTIESMETLIKVSVRLRYPEVIEYMLRKYN